MSRIDSRKTIAGKAPNLLNHGHKQALIEDAHAHLIALLNKR